MAASTHYAPVAFHTAYMNVRQQRPDKVIFITLEEATVTITSTIWRTKLGQARRAVSWVLITRVFIFSKAVCCKQLQVRGTPRTINL